MNYSPILTNEYVSTLTPPGTSGEPQATQEGTNLSDVIQDGSLQDGNFLMFYTQLRNDVLHQSVKVNDSDSENFTHLTTEQMENSRTLIATYRHLQTQYKSLTDQYNLYKVDLSKNEVIKNDIMKTKAVFLTILKDLVPQEETDKKNEFEKSSVAYDDERIDLITKNMNRLSNKILEIQLKIEKLDEQLCFIRSFFSEILNEVVPIEKRLSNSCSICLENKVNEVLVPCGHTFCSQCISRTQMSQTSRSSQKCGICRSHYSQAIKFYI